MATLARFASDRIIMGRFDSSRQFIRKVSSSPTAYFSSGITFAIGIAVNGDIDWRWRNGTETLTNLPTTGAAPSVANTAIGVRF